MNIGNIVNNQYLIRARIDEGGISETYLAFDQDNLKDVVVKLLHLSKAKDWKYIDLCNYSVWY